MIGADGRCSASRKKSIAARSEELLLPFPCAAGVRSR
jgi:hypothetical protein